MKTRTVTTTSTTTTLKKLLNDNEKLLNDNEDSYYYLYNEGNHNCNEVKNINTIETGIQKDKGVHNEVNPLTKYCTCRIVTKTFLGFVHCS